MCNAVASEPPGHTPFPKFKKMHYYINKYWANCLLQGGRRVIAAEDGLTLCMVSAFCLRLFLFRNNKKSTNFGNSLKHVVYYFFNLC
jgi:hypothetical protein